ncbi:hypothetical protein CDIK_4309 [Cucumispora dikerogammari]|nr:hypothetical protein CDIK_4309 [Cucumispora dikerogammari]
MSTNRKPRLTDAQRKLICDNHNRSMSPAEISRVFEIPYTTVKSVLKLFMSTGRINSLQSGGAKNKKITPEIKSRIRDIVDGNAGVTLKNISSIILREFRVNLGTTSVDRCIRQFHYSWKRMVSIPVRRNTEDTISIRHEYAVEFYNLLGVFTESEFIFIDEVGFSVSMRSRHGRSSLGTTPSVSVQNIKSKNISVCCAMTKDGIVYKKINTRAYNTLSFLGYLNELFDFILEQNMRNVVVVMDNVPFHKSSIVIEAFSVKNIKHIFLPPYSPFLNPIENVFSKVKTFVRASSPTSEENLIEKIHLAFDQITGGDCNGYMRLIMRNLSRCLNREVFNE